MDIQSKVAQRRAALAEQEQKAKAEADTQATERKAEQAAQETAVLEELSETLSSEEVTIVQKGGQLAFERPAIVVPEDMDTAKLSHLKRLLKTEARKRWNVQDNITAIALVAAGIPLLSIPPLGIVMILLGFVVGNKYNKKYSKEIKEDYPDLFADIDLK